MNERTRMVMPHWGACKHFIQVSLSKLCTDLTLLFTIHVDVSLVMSFLSVHELDDSLHFIFQALTDLFFPSD
jgi:hypothetical protein